MRPGSFGIKELCLETIASKAKLGPFLRLFQWFAGEEDGNGAEEVR